MKEIDADIITDWIKGNLDSGKFLVVSPYIYDLSPESLRCHPNFIKQKKLNPHEIDVLYNPATGRPWVSKAFNKPDRS
jgi:hypothetical protein